MSTAPPTAHANRVVTTLALAGITAAMTQTLVTPLLPQLPQLLDTTQGNAAWVITVTLLVAAVCVPVSGRLGDLLGKRTMLLACTVPLFAGSVLCALSSTVAPMIIGRGLQGMGMGMVPLGVALLRDVVPRERLSSSIALVSASLGIGGALGLPLASAVAQYASWRALFWGSAGLAVLVAVLIWFLVPSVPAAARGQRFDVPGALGLAAGLVALLLAISKGADWGWTSVTTLTLFAAAVVVLLVWGRWETRTRDPLIDLRSTARPRILLTNVASIFTGFAMYASMLVVPQVLQYPEETGYGLGQSMLAAGLWMAPGGLAMMLVSRVGGKLTDARGPKITLVSGTLVIAVGYALSQPLMGTPWGLMLSLLVINGGVGLAYGAMPTLIMSTVAVSETAAANGFNTLMRSLGTSVGAAVVGVVLAQLTTTLGGQVLPSEAGFRISLVLGGVLALLAAIIAAVIPTDDAAPEDGVAEGGAPEDGVTTDASQEDRPGRQATPVARTGADS